METFQLGDVVFEYMGIDQETCDIWYVYKLNSQRLANLTVSPKTNYKHLVINTPSGQKSRLFKCWTSDKIKFLYRGRLSDFYKLFGITEHAVKESSRKRKYTSQGWRFERVV